MGNDRIFIFEFVSGGGFNQVDIPPSLFCEGYGMLRSIISDFKTINFTISTILDARISFLSPYLKADSIRYIGPKDNYLKIFKENLVQNHYVFIVAPEFSNILYDLTKIAKDYNKKILSVDLAGIQLGSSKLKTFEYFKNNAVNTPATFLISGDIRKKKDYIVKKINELESPIVIKPEDGVGAESIFYCEKEYQISELYTQSEKKLDSNRSFILQEYIEGEPMSISLLGAPIFTDKQNLFPLVLSINYQDIIIKNSRKESEYLGGYTPVKENNHIKNLFLNAFDGVDISLFNSYFGIDFIYNKGKLCFLEINPRLTTSYIGVRNIMDNNLAFLILKAHQKKSEIDEIRVKDHSLFSRLELIYIGNKKREEINEYLIPSLLKKIPELITPPISFGDSHDTKGIHYSCFIATKEKNDNASKKRFAEIIEYLKQDNFQVIR